MLYTGLLPLSATLQTYFRAAIIVLLVYSGILFFDRLIVGLLKDYSSKVAFVESSAGVLKTLFRLTIFGIAALIVLDTLGISITPLVASLGVGSLAIALALQGTLSNLFGDSTRWSTNLSGWVITSNSNRGKKAMSPK